MRKSPPLLIVAGPTASGKSSLALDVAEEFDGAVINGDSMQVYRELRLLTARPSAADEARVPHRLFGVLPAGEACSAGRWLDMAKVEIETCHRQGRLPVVVGGTGLYLKALTDGLAPVPRVPTQVREEILALFDALGGEAFHARLAEVDAASAANISTGDRQRLTRAMEVHRATGRPLSQWQRQAAPQGPPVDARMATIVLLPPREDLYAAAESRFDAMMAAGALEEVKTLAALDLNPRLPAMKALGVAPLRACLEGRMSLEEAVAKAKQLTRNYGKRQLTWLKGQVSQAYEVPAQYSERIRPEIFSFVRRFLLTGQT